MLAEAAVKSETLVRVEFNWLILIKGARRRVQQVERKENFVCQSFQTEAILRW